MSYQPKPEDLNYPERLEAQQQPEEAGRDAAADGAEPAATAGGAATNGSAADAAADAAAKAESGLENFSAWYPPVQQTLLCLSKLYRCVDAKIFGGMAQEAVSSCAASVKVRQPQLEDTCLNCFQGWSAVAFVGSLCHPGICKC